jgi:hypothetical protein
MAEIDGGEINYKERSEQAQKTIVALESQLRDACRVIDVLVAVGKLKQGHVEEARQLVSTLKD